jgi:hypothetical protein
MKTATVLAAAALAVAVFGSTPIGHAAGNLLLPRNSVGTVQLKGSAVTGLKVKDGTLMAADFKAGQLPAGSQGPQGPAGPKGDKGDPGISLYANVTEAGVLESGTATAASRTGQGSYVVTFDRDLSKCAAVSSAGATGSGAWIWSAWDAVSVAGSSGANKVAITFRGPSAGGSQPVDTDFHLIVAC